MKNLYLTCIFTVLTCVVGHAQCTFTPDAGILSDLITLQNGDATASSGASNNLVCAGVDAVYSGSGTHNYWLEEDATYTHDAGASGFGTIFALNNNSIITNSSGIFDIYLGAGSVLNNNINSFIPTVWAECGATVINSSFSATIYYECLEDITDLTGNATLIYCPDISLDFPAAPAPFFSIGGAVSVDCNSFPYLLDASEVPGPYDWSTGATTPTISVDGPGTYTCSVPSACGTAAATAILSLEDGPVLDLGPDLEICPNELPVMIDAGVFDSYDWTNGADSQTIMANFAGIYAVTVTNNCGSSTDEIEVIVGPDVPVFDLGVDLSLCPSEFPLVIDAGAFWSSYDWTTGADTQQIMAAGPGVYGATVTSPCGTTYDEIEIFEEGIEPMVDLGMDISVCPADFPLVLDANGQGDLLWSTNETSPTITVGDFGTFSVTATTACGTETDEITISATSQDPVLDFGPDLAICTTEFPYTLDPGAWDSYDWDSGETSPTLQINGPGTYGVAVVNGCGNPYDEIIISDAGFAPTVNLGENMTLCSSAFPITLDAGVQDQYVWSTASTNPTIEINGAGNYSVTVTNGCGSASDEIEVSLTAAPLPLLNLGPDMPVCEGNFPFELTTPYLENVSYTWSTGSDNTSISVTAPGIYTLTQSTACENQTDEILISSLNNETESIIETLCPEESVTILGEIYTTEGQSSISTQGSASNGCDLTTNIEIIEIEVPDLQETINIPFGESEVFAGQLFNTDGTYEAEILSPEGCLQTVFVQVIVAPAELLEVFVPTSFSPNQDGLNDLFFPSLYDLQKANFKFFSFQVVDRWGEIVYETNNPYAQGWRGNHAQNPRYFVQDGVFNWILMYQERSSVEPFEKRGFVTLVK